MRHLLVNQGHDLLKLEPVKLQVSHNNNLLEQESVQGQVPRPQLLRLLLQSIPNLSSLLLSYLVAVQESLLPRLLNCRVQSFIR